MTMSDTHPCPSCGSEATVHLRVRDSLRRFCRRCARWFSCTLAGVTLVTGLLTGAGPAEPVFPGLGPVLITANATGTVIVRVHNESVRLLERTSP